MKPILLLLATTLTAKAGVIITYAEDPNAYTSSLKDTQVFDFNNLKLGKNSSVKWDSVGSSTSSSSSPRTSTAVPLMPRTKGSYYSLQGAGQCDRQHAEAGDALLLLRHVVVRW